MIKIDFFKKNINIYRILFYSLIYKYLCCYFIFIIFFYGLLYNKIDLFCCNNTKFWDIITGITLINLLIISILTIINIFLTVLNIYKFNKMNNNIENNEKSNINKIRKINDYELFIITFSFIKVIISFKFMRFEVLLFYLTILLGILPFSTLELLFYFEKKKTKLSLDLCSQTSH